MLTDDYEASFTHDAMNGTGDGEREKPHGTCLTKGRLGKTFLAVPFGIETNGNSLQVKIKIRISIRDAGKLPVMA